MGMPRRRSEEGEWRWRGRVRVGIMDDDVSISVDWRGEERREVLYISVEHGIHGREGMCMNVSTFVEKERYV